jgi:hypothetical protein
LSTRYTVDINPVNESDPDLDTREVLAHCYLYSRPLPDASLYDPASTIAPPTASTVAPKLGKKETRPPTAAPTAPQTAQMYHSCGQISAVREFEALPE